MLKRKKTPTLLIRTLYDLTQPRPIDYLFISSFEKMTLHEKITQVKKFILNGQIDYIVKSIYINPNFKEICLLDEFSKDWLALWSTYGILLSENISKGLYVQPTDSALDLFLGIYFFERTVFYNKILENQDSSIVENYLLEAIKYGSIHAYQMYHKSLYSKIDKAEANDPNTPIIFMDIINTTKQLLTHYTTYAYFMLTEAYVRYALYLSNNETDLIKILKIEQAALKCCESADRHYRIDDPIIFNASLGATLASSNSLSMSTPQEALATVKKIFEQIKSKHEMSNPSEAPSDNSATAASSAGP